MTPQSMTALDTIESQAQQAVGDYRTLGWTHEAHEVDTLLDALLASAHALDQHFAGLGLTLDLAGNSETTD